jgi:hypothetical protein
MPFSPFFTKRPSSFHVRGLRAGSDDAQYICKTVFSELRHRHEIRGESFALACFKLLGEVIHRLLDDELRGVVALACALLIGRIAVAP